MKIGNLGNMNKFLKKGEMYISRLKGFREIEEGERGDSNEGVSHSYQPDQVSLHVNGEAVEGVIGPIRTDENSDNPLIYCMYGFNSDHSKMNPESLFDRRCHDFGDTCVIIKDDKEFFNRMVKNCRSNKLNFEARFVDYVDFNSYHGEMGPFKKYLQWHAHQHEFRFVFDELTGEKSKILQIGSLEDIAELFPVSEINNIVKIQTRA
jgi:hypothetical protein